MDINFFNQHIANPATLIPAILKEWEPFYQYKAYKEFNPENHKVMNPVERPDDIVTDKDPRNPGSPGTPRIEKVARIPVPFQKLIVERLSAFMVGNEIKLKSKPEGDAQTTLSDLVTNTWKKVNKLQYRTGEIVETVLSQLECAEIWYPDAQPGKPVKMRCKIYKPSDGYGLIPVWDDHGDLIAFGLQWEDTKIKRARYMDLYTADRLERYIDTGSGWQQREESVKLPYGKIPVVYYSQPKSAWEDVQPTIEEFERAASNYMDFIDYNGNPILFSQGEVASFPRKGKAGKLVAGIGSTDDNGNTTPPDLKYVNIDSKPEAIVYQFELLERIIYSMTQCPNISFDALKSLGDISGAAYDRIFTDVHLKARKVQQGWLGQGMQRRINFLIAALSEAYNLPSATDVDIEPVFTPFSLTTDADRIDTALKANGNKAVMSQKEAIQYVGISDDAEATLEDINEEPENTDINNA